MSQGTSRFYMKIIVAIVAGLPLLLATGFSFETTIDRFGGIGLIHWFIGLGATGLGVLALWAGAVSHRDRRNLARYRAGPTDTFRDGQVVALSGRLRVEGEPLKAPFSGVSCAAYSYRVSGQRRVSSSSGTGTRSQPCLLGVALAPAVLDTGERSYRFLAVPDVDTDFRETALGGEWGDRALERVLAARDDDQAAGMAQADGWMSDAARHAEPPLAFDWFISTGDGGAPSMSVSEDAVPVDEPITVLGTFVAGDRGLDGRRTGGMKVFKGELEERLDALALEFRKSMKIGVPSLLIGLGLMTLAGWWPGA